MACRHLSILVMVAVFALAPAVGLATTIYDVQHNETTPGTGNDCFPSPFDDQVVTVSGIVTMDSIGNGYNDFWIQEADTAWSGVFVYQNTYDLVVGDSVTLWGALVDEYYGLTELKNLDSISVHSQGHTLPAPIDISTGDLAAEDSCFAVGEHYEGVLVRVQIVACTDVGGFGEWLVDDGSGECLIEDYIYEYVPNVGDNFASITGIVHYSYGQYRIEPREAGDIIPETPVESTGDPGILPAGYSLSQNYPNPFNPETEIRYALPERAYVRLEVYNLLGQRVATLVNGPQEAGGAVVRWDGTSDEGTSLASGIYFYHLQAGEYSATRKMVYLK